MAVSYKAFRPDRAANRIKSELMTRQAARTLITGL